MTKGSNIVPHSCSSGYWSGVTSSTQRPAANHVSQAYENTTRVKYEDNKSGSYQQFTAKEKVSTSNLHVERGRGGRVGVKDEYITSSTIKIGNKRGYTEYSCQERVRDVEYFGDSSNKQQKVIGEYKSADDDYEYGVDGGNEYQVVEPDNNVYGFEDVDNRYSDYGSVGDYDDDDDYY